MFSLLLGFLLAAPALADEPTPPPEVEPGSKREIYVVKAGDTLRSIADAHAFLVDDLARWNGLKNVDQITPGQELVMWVAPRELTAAPTVAPPAPEKPPKEPREGVGAFVGLQVGPAIALNPLSPALLPRLEAGIELPPWERRIRLFVGGTWSRPVDEATVEDARVPDGSWSYRLEQTEISVASGITLRATGDGKLVPELSIGPGGWYHRAVVDGASGGSAFGETSESYWRFGVYSSVGAALALGPGELNLQLAFATTGFGGLVAGKTGDSSLTPLLGYRLVF
jgi:hypothetical protein